MFKILGLSKVTKTLIGKYVSTSFLNKSSKNKYINDQCQTFLFNMFFFGFHFRSKNMCFYDVSFFFLLYNYNQGKLQYIT